MNGTDMLVDAFGRIQSGAHAAVRGLTTDQLAQKPYRNGNTIAWLLWHATRVQDSHLAEAASMAQLWSQDGWFDRFGLPFPVEATGYGHTAGEVEAVRVSAEMLLGYHDSVCERSLDWIRGLTEEDLDRVVDESWDPPVRLGVRLVSVISDDLQHIGQAAYLRGLLLD